MPLGKAGFMLGVGRVGGCGGRGFGSGDLVGWVAGPREVNGIALHQHTHLENRGL